MQLPRPAPDVIRYRCNVCGARNALPAAEFHRELAVCGGCGANARFRGIVAALGERIGMASFQRLDDWPVQRELQGAGFSDWPGYAARLERKFAYRNTHYDRAPRLDLTDPGPEWEASLDFVICSDVLEHVAPPVQTAFDNLCRLLRPGGHLIFSVPYNRAPATAEHYPGLAEFEILDFRGEPVLVNRDAAGRLQVYDGLVFHGGEGATLELRLFCEADVLERLRRAGFEDVRVHDQPLLEIGYYWPPLPGQTPDAPLLYAYVISARRPA